MKFPACQALASLITVPMHITFLFSKCKNSSDNPLIATRHTTTVRAAKIRMISNFSTGFCANWVENLYLEICMYIFLFWNSVWDNHPRNVKSQGDACQIAGNFQSLTTRGCGCVVWFARQNTHQACDWVSSASDGKQRDKLLRAMAPLLYFHFLKPRGSKQAGFNVFKRQLWFTPAKVLLVKQT